MKRSFLLLTGAALFLGGLIWLWIGKDTISGKEVPGLQNPAPIRESDIHGPGELQRFPVPVEEVSPEPYWREVEGVSGMLLAAFQKNYLSDGGEEKEVRNQSDFTERMIAAGNWAYIDNALALFDTTDLVVDNSASITFQDLVGIEMSASSNMLIKQVEFYRQWKKESKREGAHFPHAKIRDFPLAFAPEMHFEYFTGMQSIDLDCVRSAAVLRDKAIRNYAALRLDRAILLPSIEQAVVDIGVTIPHREKEEAFRASIPDYDNVMKGIEDVEREYVSGLLALLVSHGISVLEER